jgi:hypothetical protein
MILRVALSSRGTAAASLMDAFGKIAPI